MRVAIVSCDKWKDKIKEDELIVSALKNNGVQAEILSWEDQTVDYKKFDCLLLRSVWGYQYKYKEFKEWLNFLKRNNIKIYNDVDLILNNIQKNIQFQILTKHNIPIINTIYITSVDEINEMLEINTKDIVVKPVVSGSGNETFKLPNDINKIEILKDILEKNNVGLFVQPFLEEIKDGEYACIYIDGENVYNMLRYPGVLYEKKTPVILNEIPSIVKEVANKVASIPDYNDYLYMRVDIVISKGKAVVMEVELAEPDLMMKYLNNGLEKADILVKKLIRRIK